MTNLNDIRIDSYDIGDKIKINIITKGMIGDEVSLSLYDNKADFVYNGIKLANDTIENLIIRSNTETLVLTVIEQM